MRYRPTAPSVNEHIGSTGRLRNLGRRMQAAPGIAPSFFLIHVHTTKCRESKDYPRRQERDMFSSALSIYLSIWLSVLSICLSVLSVRPSIHLFLMLFVISAVAGRKAFAVERLSKSKPTSLGVNQFCLSIKLRPAKTCNGSQPALTNIAFFGLCFANRL